MATFNNVSQPQIPMFTGKNYDILSVEMRTLFHSQDIWDLVETGFVEPQDQLIWLYHKLKKIL